MSFPSRSVGFLGISKSKDFHRHLESGGNKMHLKVRMNLFLLFFFFRKIEIIKVTVIKNFNKQNEVKVILKINFRWLMSVTLISFLSLSFFSCSSSSETQMETQTWAEKIGYPEGSNVLLLHIDDAGMCDEANLASKNYFDRYEIQSGVIMVPCPSAGMAMHWAAQNPHVDVGLHLTLTSEWKTYRWGTVADSLTGKKL